MPVYLTPGVYRTPQATPQPRFVLVRTDVAGFLGFAERGPLPEDFPDPKDTIKAAVKITSWKEFQATFGGFMASGYLAYAVRAFFENGGDTCFVARIAATTASDAAQRPARAQYLLPSAAPVAVGTLSAVGSGNAVTISVAAGGVLRGGDLIQIVHAGLTTTEVVTDNLGGGLFLLSKPLTADHAAGDAVLSYPSAFRVEARSAGNWGNNIRVVVTPLDAGAFGLQLTVDRGAALAPVEHEFYRRLTIASPDAVDYAPTVLTNNSQLANIRVTGGGQIRGFAEALPGPLQFHLTGGRDGLSAVSLRDFLGSDEDRRGLRLFEDIDDISTVCAPDASFPGVKRWKPIPPPLPVCADPPVDPPAKPQDDSTAQAPPISTQDSLTIRMNLIQHCERLRYRVALIDPPFGMHPNDVQTWPESRGLRNRSARFAALYYPWIAVPDPLQLDGLRRLIPPSGHVAGVYAQNDLTHGVFHPPANYEIQFAAAPAEDVSDDQQAGLNPKRVNAIRSLPGRGIRVWGARSLASDSDGEWEFIHVRRLMSAIEKTVEISSRWAVFENNNFPLRRTMTHSLNVLLESIWAQGGLKGRTPAEGYYVRCDETNNPQPVIDSGMLICEIGVAVAVPMEFLVFEIRRNVGAMEVAET
jgi:Phage tail sheath protein FI